MNVRTIARAGVIAGTYAALTLVVLQLPLQLGYGLLQFRPSEAVTVVACFTPAAIPGLWIGAAVANAFNIGQVGPIALLDVIFGSLASLLGAIWTWRHRARPALALAGPVVSNALIVPAYLPLMLAGLGLYTVPILGIDVEGSWIAMYLLGVVMVGVSEAVVVYGLGLPLLHLLRRLGAERMLS